MIRIIISALGILILLFFLQGCKKESGAAKKMYLSKVYQNGLLDEEYFYDAEGRPYRRNSFNTSQGQSNPAGYRLYQYDSKGLVSKVIDMGNDNAANQVLTLLYDVEGRPARIDDRDGAEALQQYYTFTYNSNGQLTEYTVKNGATDKTLSLGFYGYDQSGQLNKQIRRYYNGATLVLFDSATFVISKPIPSEWKYLETIPLIGLLPANRFIFDMSFESLFIYRADAPPQKTTFTFSNRQYNPQGYLTGQSISVKTEYIGPITFTNTEMKYEYIEL